MLPSACQAKGMVSLTKALLIFELNYTKDKRLFKEIETLSTKEYNVYKLLSVLLYPTRCFFASLRSKPLLSNSSLPILIAKLLRNGDTVSNNRFR
jgi:hypothetical protein